MSNIIWIKVAMDEYYKRAYGNSMLEPEKVSTILKPGCTDALSFEKTNNIGDTSDTTNTQNNSIFSNGFVTRLFEQVLYDKNDLMKDIVL